MPERDSQRDSRRDSPRDSQLEGIKRERRIFLAAILAQSLNGVIGRDGQLPWHEPADLKLFKQRTMGSFLIMGRRTWQSINKRPLPGRHLIVMSREGGFALPAAIPQATDPAAALRAIPPRARAFVVGGASVYRSFLLTCDELFVTLIKELSKGDVTFNALNQISAVDWRLDSIAPLSSRADLYHFKRRQGRGRSDAALYL